VAISQLQRTSLAAKRLAFSPDEKILYVADSSVTHDPHGAHEIVAFDVSPEGKLSSRRTFAIIDPGVPDGLRVDVDGNIWTSAADGVHCIALTAN